MSRRARILVLTGGHPSTCPRMLRAADTLAAAGHAVRLLSVRFVDWAVAADRHELGLRSGRFRWEEIDLMALGPRAVAGFARHAARRVARRVGPERLPHAVKAQAFGRAHLLLSRAAGREPYDLVYAGTAGALAAGHAIAARTGAKLAIDLEDYHLDEALPSPDAQLDGALIAELLGPILPDAAFVTAGSTEIAAAYARRFGRAPVAIHNVLPLPPLHARPANSLLRVGWFGQTVGPGRGLELALRALGRLDRTVTLELRGRPDLGFLATLEALRAREAPRVNLLVEAPVPPSELPARCAASDVGLALEPGGPSLNNALLLSNKALTYCAVGVPIAITDTPGQRALVADLGPGAIATPPAGELDEELRVERLATGLRVWVDDPAARARAAQAARAAAERRWCWEHEAEGPSLLGLVERALGGAPT